VKLGKLPAREVEILRDLPARYALAYELRCYSDMTLCEIARHIPNLRGEGHISRFRVMQLIARAKNLIRLRSDYEK